MDTTPIMMRFGEKRRKQMVGNIHSSYRYFQRQKKTQSS